jgi:predicted amidophosphoribosyltransferase
MSHCSACGASLGESVRFCSQCGAPVEIPAAKPETRVNAPAAPVDASPPALSAAPPPARPPVAPTAEAPPSNPPLPEGGRIRVRVPAPPRQTPAAPPPPRPPEPPKTVPAGKKWYYQDQGQPNGPVDEPELAQRLAAGKLKADGLVWTEGLAAWIPAQDAGLITPPPPPAPELPPLPSSTAATPPPMPPPPVVATAAPSAGTPLCPRCGVDLPASARFCRACGAPAALAPRAATPVATDLPPPPPPPTPAPACPQCGSPWTPAAKFCRHCGAARPATPAVDPSGTCPACQAALRPGAEFCGQCGHRLKAAAPPRAR